MARLARLRQWWRSHFRRRVTAEGFAAHRAMNLLPPPRTAKEALLSPWDFHRAIEARRKFREAGMPPERGSWVLSASTDTKAPGTPTLVMGTTGGCSSFSEPGKALGVEGALTLYRLGSNSTAPFLYGVATDLVGVSGEQLGSAG